MRGYNLAKSFSTPAIQRSIRDGFGLKKDVECGYVEAAYYNGLGRQVNQLKRLTLKFCKTTVQSKGVRDFIEQDLIDFTHKHPDVVVYLKPRRFKTGVVVGEYLDGSYHWQSFHKMSREEIGLWLDLMTTRSGQAMQMFLKEHKIDWPSVQGAWHPFLNKPTDLNVTPFPNEKRAQFRTDRPTATERLIEIANELNESRKNSV